MSTQRSLLQPSGNTFSILQLIGFIAMLAGIISMSVAAFLSYPFIPSLVAVSFFVIMLGMCFAFPAMLEGPDGPSAMRITVFMIISLVSLLTIKIGWAEGIRSLKEIGLDQAWVALAGFAVGAKATQKFIETRGGAMARKPDAGK